MRTSSSQLLLLVFVTGLLYGQTGSINNTLGSGGSFVVKDGSTTFLSLSQSTGFVGLSKSLTLPTATSSTIGVIFKGADRFIHDYQDAGTFGLNTFVGVNSGNFTMSGTDFQASENTSVGYASMSSLSTGYYNSALGSYSLNANTTGYYNSAFGHGSLYLNSTGYVNTAVGHESLYSNITGYENTSVGAFSSFSNFNGIRNTAVGEESMYSNSTGYYNTALGYQSVANSITGTRNTGVGYQTLLNSTASVNTAVGFSAGSTITSGSNLTCIGNNAQPSSGTITDQITLGDGFVTMLRCAVITITAISDARDKKNIRELTLGLDFITKIKPRLFNWDRREWYENNVSDGTKMQKVPTAGFIAQELDEVQTAEQAEWLNLVLKDNPEKLEATPGNLLPVIVKAIQELKANSDRKDALMAKLQSDNEELKEMLMKFEGLHELLVSEIKKLKSEEEKTIGQR